MSTMSRNHAQGLVKSRICWLDAEMAELSLLLPGWQAAEMERLAHARGQTLGHLLRLLIRDYLADPGRACPAQRTTGTQHGDTSE